ncbi:MAG: FAD-binding oxidoreductase, partial [Flavobacteriales bacterium]|nr:FAD-binding oxidoreductase [Flavobacteriales bacterium]
MENFGGLDLRYAESDEEKIRMWKLRRKVGEAVKSHSVYKEEDTVVPRYALPVLLDGVKKIGRRYGFQSVCYGHAGDGNLHVNIIRGEMPEQAWHDELPKAIREIFALCIKLGGTLSGEHGIGWVQKPYMDMAFSDTELALMQRIKHAFDPNQILNPGKIFPDK